MSNASANGGRTGWPPGLLQDDCPQLSRWFATRAGARYLVRLRVAEITEERKREIRSTLAGVIARAIEREHELHTMQMVGCSLWLSK